MPTTFSNLFPHKSVAFLLLIAPAFCCPVLGQTKNLSWEYNLTAQKPFIKNYGQFSDKIKNVNPAVEYATENNGAQIYFTRAGHTYRYDQYVFSKEKEEEKPGEEEKKDVKLNTFSFSFEWIGADPNVEIIASDIVKEYFLYPSGDQKTNIRAEAYKKIIYKNLYPNIDVEYSIHEKGGLKYSLLVKPGADLSQVKFRYVNSDKSFLDDAGNLHVSTAKGSLIDHAPGLSYRADGKFVKARFTFSKGVIGFETDNYDASQLLVIDPWTINPGLPSSNRGFDVARDVAGNIYVCGGFGGNYELRKFSSTGTLLWNYNASTTIGFYYGDFAVDYNANIYISSGCCTGLIIKLDPAGNLKWTHPYSSQFYEIWRMAFDCNYNYMIAGGGPYNFSPGYWQIAAIDTANGNFINPDSIGAMSELRSLAIAPTGNTYGLYVSPSSSGSTLTNYLIATTGPLWNKIYNVSSNYTLAETPNTQYTGTNGFSGFNGIVINSKYVYTTDGATLRKWNIATGVQISTATLPGGTTDMNSGIILDGCGNVYAGSGNGIYKFDSTLAFITSVATGIVYDLCMGDNNEIIASGDGFLGSYALNACQPKLQLAPSSTPACQGQASGTASVNVTGGTGPYTYSWKPTGGTSSTANNLTPGSYTVIVTDYNGCNGGINDTVITVGNLGTCGVLMANANPTNIKCKGQNDGIALASPVGGTGPYIYTWSNGQTSQTIINLPAGTYTVTITDATPLDAITTVTITEPAASLTASAAQNMWASCGINNGIAVATASGGTGTLTYTWSSGATTATATNLGAGNYIVTVKDANNCTLTASATIASFGGPSITSVIVTNGTCLGGTGNAVAAASGGSGVLIYSWSSGAFTQTATNLATGTYTVTVTDGNACTATSTATISNGSNPGIASFNTSGPNCTGQNSGTATVNANGGTGALTYSWSSGAATATANNLNAGTFTVTVTDASGCTNTSSVTLTDPPALVINSVTTSPDVCSSNSGSATISALGGTGTLTYSWSSGATTADANNLAAITYSITVTDNKGCTALSTANVPAVTSITASSGPDSSICAGQTVQLSGAGGSTYTWNPAASLSSGSSANPVASPTVTTSYTLTVQSGTCSDTEVVAITVTPLPVAVAGSDETIFKGTSVQLNASGGISFSWSPATALDNPTIYNPTATPDQTTTYTLTVTDANGCVSTDYLTITVDVPPPCSEKDVFVPSAFSPNRDGQNDLLLIRGSNYCLKQILLQVFNRWGEIVFETTDINNGWNGVFRGQDLDPGVFAYVLKTTSYSGEKVVKHGNVTLMR